MSHAIYGRHTDTELEISLWHLTTARKQLEEAVDTHKHQLPFTSGFGHDGPAASLINRWEHDIKTIAQHQLFIARAMQMRGMKPPSYSGSIEQWQDVFDSIKRMMK